LPAAEAADREVFSAVLALPENWRSCVYLYYYEGYTVSEIAGMLRRSPGTIKTWLSRGRKALRDRLGGEFDD
jgi:RNA polymerase sigma-70 factor (ECF subfamily)